ncbi:cysteine hydrolase family protein [Spirillospora albida]|uniref:cysteine hydrolase family protein n=1 Tax=Spirillospora albida TaxID=58123 RepID=UPI0004BECC68|nr:isochorismatase family cysteine hydrolase [Spirillospora albida]
MSIRALIVVDMLNPYDHKDADRLTAGVEQMIEPLRSLLDAASRRDDVRMLYVNDNHGDFAASRDDLVTRALAGRRPDLVEPVVPPDDCAFLPKVRHSAFYGTPLEYLLTAAGIDEVVITGQVTEQCVLYSALDAYVRDFRVTVPRDAVAHIHPDLRDATLRMMELNMSANITTAAACL